MFQHAIIKSFRDTRTTFLTFFLASGALTLIALAADWALRALQIVGMKVNYPLDHVFALIDIDALTAFVSLFLFALAGLIIFETKAVDHAYLIIKDLFMNAFSGLCGAMCAIGFIMMFYGQWDHLTMALENTALAFLLIVSWNAGYLKLDRPSSIGVRTTVGVLLIIAAIAFPGLVSSLITVEPTKLPPASELLSSAR